MNALIDIQIGSDYNLIRSFKRALKAVHNLRQESKFARLFNELAIAEEIEAFENWRKND